MLWTTCDICCGCHDCDPQHILLMLSTTCHPPHMSRVLSTTYTCCYPQHIMCSPQHVLQGLWTTSLWNTYMLWTTFDMLRGYPLQCSVVDNRFYVVGVCGGLYCCGGHTCCGYHLYVVGICCGQHLSIVYVVGVDMLWVTCIHNIYQCSPPHMWVPYMLWVYVVDCNEFYRCILHLLNTYIIHSLTHNTHITTVYSIY